MKDTAIFGMSDSKLKEKAPAEDPNLDTIVKWRKFKKIGYGGTLRSSFTDIETPGCPGVRHTKQHTIKLIHAVGRVANHEDNSR